ncbi:hypothetical protein HG530_000960 [Fusarium avenaceum]|nr:hypothetical protein HG530_000960 [Fusarium avenaceum]
MSSRSNNLAHPNVLMGDSKTQTIVHILQAAPNFLTLNIDLECFTSAIEIPQAYLAVETTGCDPIRAHILRWGCNTLDIIGMLAYRLNAGIVLLGIWPPNLYLHVGMSLSAELGRVLRLLVFGGGRCRIGDIAAAFEIEV